jgi:hypothetical protein
MKLYSIDSGRRGPRIRSNLGQVYANSEEEAVKKILILRMDNLLKSSKNWKARIVKGSDET